MGTNSSSTSKYRWFKVFGFLFITTSSAAFLIYFGIMLTGNSQQSPVTVTDGFHGGHLEAISEHPFAFLLTISFIIALMGTYWVSTVAPKSKQNQTIQLLTIPWIALILTSPIWGVIWSVFR